MSKVLIRVSVDFLLTDEEHNRIPGKYVPLLDKDGKAIAEGELYTSGYETEDGDDCNEDGEPFI